MPFYEYKTKEDGCPQCVDVLEVSQSILDDPLRECPHCGKEIVKLLSVPGGIIIGNRAPNQYNDCKGVKYWRDKNGTRHKVTNADGRSRAHTVTKQTKGSEEVTAIKKAASKARTKQRSKDSYKRFRTDVKKKHGI